ncbi:NAD(P)H-dependent oxidoreductase [Streptomyces sioyaensis]|uniref:NAD(P)H-dependent oxidoreductase n=1 Tax=Streptomyces sioyaensis TaxID=67364 RepID=UPI00366720B6
MRIGVYLAHPCPGSFNHAVFTAVVEELRDRGCHVLAHDLYAEGFAPVLTADETETVQSATSARDVQVELHRSEVATLDAMVLVHPNWWGMPPATSVRSPTRPTNCAHPGCARHVSKPLS